jgi:HTH-type transcriptional regulator/antitoxin MqsA
MRATALDTSSPVCPACGEGHLTVHTQWRKVEHAGHQGQVPMHLSICNACGSELATADDALANKRAMIAFEKQAEGLMSGKEVRQWRNRYGLTQQQAATFLGGGKIGFSRYENDDVVQSTAMDSLLRLCQKDPSNLLKLAHIRHLELPKETLLAISLEGTEAPEKLMPKLSQALDAIKAKTRWQSQGAHGTQKVKPVFLERLPANQELYTGSAVG